MVIPPEFRPTGGIAIDSEVRSWAAASGSWIGYGVDRYQSSTSDYDYFLEWESLKDRMECNADFGSYSVRIISGWDEKGIFLTPGQKYVVVAV